MYLPGDIAEHLCMHQCSSMPGIRANRIMAGGFFYSDLWQCLLAALTISGLYYSGDLH